MRDRRALLFAVLTSIGAHVLLFGLATSIQVPGVKNDVSKTERLFKIKALKKEEPKTGVSPNRPASPVETLKFQNPQMAKTLDHFSVTEEKMIDKASFDSPAQEIDHPIKQIPQQEIKDVYKIGKQDITFYKKKKERITREEMVMVSASGEPSMLTVPPGILDGSEGQLAEAFYDKMPGFTPQLSEQDDGEFPSLEELLNLDGGEAGGPITQRHTKVIDRTTSYEDIQKHVSSHVLRYTDPRDGQKYFQITLHLGEEALASVPKEIIFLVDCSSSIQEDRFAKFQKGIALSLRLLRADDKFNIGAFKKSLIWFQPQSVSPTSDNIQSALDFVHELTVRQKTDTYNALFESLQRGSSMTPSYIILFSDGRPTHGETNTTKIIQEIAHLNEGKQPIFAVSGGIGVNRYFLDFISYKNRGWTEYSHRGHQIDRITAALMKKISTPILMDLSYRVSGLKNEELFPRLLPDLFRNLEFTLFGKFTDEQEFSFQLLGNHKGSPKEFIMVSSLNNAPQGTEEIAKSWAFNKIYHLIGQLQYDRDNQDIIQEISQLSKKFGINTPYTAK